MSEASVANALLWQRRLQEDLARERRIAEYDARMRQEGLEKLRPIMRPIMDMFKGLLPGAQAGSPVAMQPLTYSAPMKSGIALPPGYVSE